MQRLEFNLNALFIFKKEMVHKASRLYASFELYHRQKCTWIIQYVIIQVFKPTQILVLYLMIESINRVTFSIKHCNKLYNLTLMMIQNWLSPTQIPSHLLTTTWTKPIKLTVCMQTGPTVLRFTGLQILLRGFGALPLSI